MQRVCRKCGQPANVERDARTQTIVCTNPLCGHREQKVFTSKGG